MKVHNKANSKNKRAHKKQISKLSNKLKKVDKKANKIRKRTINNKIENRAQLSLLKTARLNRQREHSTTKI
jgi:hypothetical protein